VHDQNPQRTVTIERLLSAAAGIVAMEGLAQASARRIAAACGVAPSAVNYSFGGLDALLAAAFSEAAGRARVWAANQSEAFARLPDGPAGARAALEHLVLDWTAGERALACLHAELSACPERYPDAAATWADAWGGLFDAVSARFDLSEATADIMRALFESEAVYHLSEWAPPLERLVWREHCDRFAALWLGGPPATAAPPGLARVEALLHAQSPDPLPLAAARIAEAALGVIDREGLEALTHRAVAAAAGLTSGAVAYHFRTAPDLVAAAALAQHARSVRDMSETPAEAADARALTREAVQQALRGASAPSGVRQRRALFIAAARRPDLATIAARMRFSHGGTARRLLTDGEARPLDASLLSRIVSALWLATANHEISAARRQAALDLVLTAGEPA
jgi:DNA-binding transcriptional regulator YbjK